MKSIASLSLDLDNKWAYMKTHGDSGWESFPSYLNVVVPRILSFLKERGLTITFFVVGQDAALGKNKEALGQIAAAGHEIGNHSFHHDPWLHLYSTSQIENELASAEEHIEWATGRRPVGFRGPGFSLSQTTLEVLARRSYLYDASTFPTFIGPLARAYYFMTANLSREEMRQRKNLYGSLRNGWQSIKPYRWQTKAGTLIEIPVTTLPIIKTPIHLSYILYLANLSSTVALRYFQTALKACQLTSTQPSLLLHPLDFLGCDDTSELSFFPGMNLPSEKKLAIVSEVLSLLSNQFTVVTVRHHANEVAKVLRLPLIESNLQQLDRRVR